MSPMHPIQPEKTLGAVGHPLLRVPPNSEDAVRGRTELLALLGP